MGVDFRAVVAVGFELSYEDYAAEVSWRISHEPDEGRKWAKEIQDYLIILDEILWLGVRLLTGLLLKKS